MRTTFDLPSSDPALLAKARRIAEVFAREYRRPDVVGIVFLGAIVRGYFDSQADVDLAIFTRGESELLTMDKFRHIEGLEVQTWVAGIDEERLAEWDMSKRWTYSRGQIWYDPLGKAAQLLAEKVSLREDERRWMVMSGLTLSEWYANRLTDLWVLRGSLVSAHQMFNRALDFFFDLLFGLNNELTPDPRWRYYCAEQLERLPADFRARYSEVLMMKEVTLAELERRKAAFMGMWNELRPLAEAEVGMTFEEMVEVV